MPLKQVTLAQTIVIADITHRDLVKLVIEEIEGVNMVTLTFLDPDSRGQLRPQTTTQPLSDTMVVGAFNAWLNQLLP